MEVTFNEFYKELIPFRNWIAFKTDLRRLRFDRGDFIGFADEKIYDVWLRYNEELDKDTLIAIARTTLYKLPLHLNAKYGKFQYQEYLSYSTEELLVDAIPNANEVQINPDYTDKLIEILKEGFDNAISSEELKLIKLILNPPSYILSKVKNSQKRIPTKLFLEFLDIEISPLNIAKFNSFRRSIFKETKEFYLGVS
jgi:hypothetical protein